MRVRNFSILILLAAAGGVLFWHLSAEPARKAKNSEVADSPDRDAPGRLPLSNRTPLPANKEKRPVKNSEPKQPDNVPEKPLPDGPRQADEPERQAPNILDAPLAPNFDPSLTDADYEAIAGDPNGTDEERREARKKKYVHFASWPGRNSGSMGGFYFKQSDYRELNGWMAPTDGTSVPDNTSGSRIENIDAGYQGGYFDGAFCMRRMVIFTNSKSKFGGIGIEIVVANSVYWAQQELIANSSGKYGGDSPELAVADNSFFDSRQGRISFTRNNVFIELTFGNIKELFDDNTALSLARSIDRQIVAQSVAARDWSELANIRPQIQRFDFATYRMSTKVGYYPKLVYAEFSDPRPAAKGHFVNTFPRTEKSEASLGWEAGKSGEPGQGSVDYHFLKDNTVTRVWLYAYNESLLFSVAERTIETIADGKPDDK